MKKTTLTLISIITVFFMTVNQSCDEKTTEEPPAVDIEFSQSPSTAYVDSTITFTFEAVEAGAAHDDEGEEHHFELSMVTCEIHFESAGTEEDLNLTKIEDGHYEGSHTFAVAGTYELHFSYMYESEMFEKEFEIEVMAN